MADRSHNFLTDDLIRTRRGETVSLSLPDVFAALARNEITAFPALRPHQRHAWHAFLVQLGALALSRAGHAVMPEDEATWCSLLRGLTPDHPDDAPWCLVTPPDRPALLQPPIPGGLRDLKNVVATPDALDMLVTSKNHDLKSAVMMAAEPDDWLFALVTLQTTEGFLGAGNYGISRMNGGFANRPALGIAPTSGAVSSVRRDIEALVALRRAGDVPVGYDASKGLGLVWLRPWDGATSVQPSELDPLYIEICRRVRLVEEGGRITARAGNSKVPRIVPIPGGVTGDPWAPTVNDKDGMKVLTVDAGGFHYRRMVRLLFGAEGHAKPALAQIITTDADEGLVIVARALTRGQGKTEGLHERRIPVTKVVYAKLRSRDTEPLARAATERVGLAGDIQGRVLKPALLALFQNGPDQIDYKDKGAEARARDILARFDRAVDASFFDDLWAECACTTDEAARAARGTWVRHLVQGVAWPLVVQADAGLSKAVGRRWRALIRAEALFWAGMRNRKTGLPPFFTDSWRRSVTTQPDPDGVEPPIRSRAVARIAARLAHERFGTGPLADLRRLDPTGVLSEPTLHRLLARSVTEAALRELGLPAWALIIHAGALAAPGHLSTPRRDSEPTEAEEQPGFWREQSRRAGPQFGRALFEAGFSERRFATLLDAGEEDLRIALPRAVRFLVAAGKRLPILAVADLVASARFIEDERAQSVRHGIARGYYQAEAKADAEPTSSALGDAA